MGACRGVLGAGLEADHNCCGLEREGLKEGYISSKTHRFDAKKINKFNRTIRFTGRTVGSFYPILIHPISGPIFKIIVKFEFRFGLYTKTHKTVAVVEGSNPPTEAGKWLNFELTALTVMSTQFHL